MAKLPKTSKASKASAPVAADLSATVVPLPVSRKAFIERVAASAGLKTRDARAAADAVLAELAAAIRSGEEMNLPPLGKVKHVKSKDIGSTRVATVRLRLSDPDNAKPAPEGLADAGEEG